MNLQFLRCEKITGGSSIKRRFVLSYMLCTLRSPGFFGWNILRKIALLEIEEFRYMSLKVVKPCYISLNFFVRSQDSDVELAGTTGFHQNL